MDRSVYIAVTLLFLVVVDSSDASFLLNFRKLIGVPPHNNSTSTQFSPQPSPESGGKESNQSKVDADKPGKDKTKNSQETSNSSNVDPKSSKSETNNMGSMDSHTSEHTVNTADSKPGTSESCDGSAKKCKDQKNMIACIQNFTSGPKEVVLLIQNEGESTLMVNFSIETRSKLALPTAEIPKHQSKKVNTSLTMATTMKIILNAGNGNCVLHLNPSVSERNFIQQLSFYSKQVNPIYGAYFLLLVTLILGGTWACCKLWKRRRQSGVPYQELEMGLPESASAANVDTAEGWDQDWDDDWDEDNAVKSPAARHVAGISADGLTSRSSKRDGWEKDWED